MQITLFPIRTDVRFKVSRKGDSLIIDGEVFDFSALPDGAELPASAVSHDAFCGSVRREDGQLLLSLLHPHDATATSDERTARTVFPEDGPIMAGLAKSQPSDKEQAL